MIKGDETMNYPPVKRNILLNPGPATTTDTVKYAQVVPDICPREKEFQTIMTKLGKDIVRVVHGNPDEYTAVLFCGSGTICIDSCISSLVPDGKKILIANNGAYSQRAADVCEFYHIAHINLKLSILEPVDVTKVEDILKKNDDIAAVYVCHHETGTGILNPIAEIGAIAHKYNAIMIADTISSYAMVPINVEKDNLDFIMGSSQKGLMSMTGLSFVIGKTSCIEASKNYETRSYYSNLYMQYDYIKTKGEMHFTPPVQTIYATRQAMKEYWDVGETAKWNRHQRVWKAICDGVESLGFELLIPKEYQSRLVVAVKYPDSPSWDFQNVHDYCYEQGFTIYPGKVSDLNTFRLCSLGTLEVDDIMNFFIVLSECVSK